MTHAHAGFLERWHQLLYSAIRGHVYEVQYVGTTMISEDELERELFHPTGARYNWLAYWKKHADDGRDSEGSWKLRWPRHRQYVDRGMQLHITLFPVTEGDGRGLDVYAHYEYDNVRHPIKHLKEEKFSAEKGVTKARQYFLDNDIDLYKLR